MSCRVAHPPPRRSQGASSDRRDLLGDQAAHDGLRRVDLRLPRSQRESVSRGRRRLRRLRRRDDAAAPRRPVCPVDLLAGGRDGRRLRDDGRGRAARRVRCPVHRLDDPVRGPARRGVLGVVARRAHAVDPQHHDGPARAVLLGGGARDVRDGHGARRSRRVHAQARLPLRRDRLRRPVRAARDSPTSGCASTRSLRSGRRM